MVYKTMSEEQKAERPSIFIATPMYGGQCYGNYVHGLLSTIATMKKLGVPVYWANMTNESLITRARNELTRQFLEGGYDYLMFIDADIQFTGQDVATLLAADCDVACGIYPKKEVNWDNVKKAVAQGKEDIEDFAGAFVLNMAHDEVETDKNGMVEVRHGGTGFMLIKRKVFETLDNMVPRYRRSTEKDEQGEYIQPETKEYFATSIDKTGALLSEDYHFCELWRDYGGKIYACPFLKLSHVGTYIYTGDILKSGGELV